MLRAARSGWSKRMQHLHDKKQSGERQKNDMKRKAEALQIEDLEHKI
jgi:hypothetical protein